MKERRKIDALVMKPMEKFPQRAYLLFILADSISFHVAKLRICASEVGLGIG